MRPLELRLRNFRSFFGDGHVFDFRDRHLVGIVGPIGSGKSTILDAIAFALYGRTPRVNRSTRSLIHQRADHAAVALRFEVDGQIWEAVRQLRAKGQSQHALYLLEEDTPDPESVSEKIVLEGEVNERIESLLGLEYEAFGRSVLLAQGQFADFLTSRPGERDRVLKGVFGHERIDEMRGLAKAKSTATDHEIEKLGIRLEQAEAALGRLEGLRETLAEKARRLASLEAAQPEHEQLTESIATTDSGVEAAVARMSELTRMAEKLPDPARSEEAIAGAERARVQRTMLADELKAAHASATVTEASIKSDEFVERSKRLKLASELIVRLESQQEASSAATSHVSDAAVRLAASQIALVEGAESVDSADHDLASATATSGTATHLLATAEQKLTDARHADMASSLRHELRSGQACPVCDQPVHELPSAGAEATTKSSEAAVVAARRGRDEAEAALRSATAALEAGRAARAASATRVGESEKEHVRAEAAAAEAATAVQASLDEIARLLGKGDPAFLLEAERIAIDALGGQMEAARKAVEEIRRTLDDAIAIEQEADRALGDLRTRLGALATQLDAATELPEDDPGALRDALRTIRDGWRTSTEDLQRTIDRDQAALVVARGRLEEMREMLEIQGPFADALAVDRAEVKLIETQIVDNEAVVAASGELIKERGRLENIADSYRRLSTDLSDARFIRFLLDEERGTLGELGSNHFQRLSSGRYRFSDDGTFQVVDLTAADAIRKADSLSGGETFLASLGLALGLSEMVGRIGGRLDAFFLDEGFGSLDSEHLDLAMEGIEALVTEYSQRLVVVVSHVPELRHRVEDLIVLDRDPITGDSIVLNGATR